MKTKLLIGIVLLVVLACTGITSANVWGCTPGYWKNHVALWPADISEVIAPNTPDTYLETLYYHGGNGEAGALRILNRAATAARLNDYQFGDAYPCYYTWRALYGEAVSSHDRATIIRNAAVIDACNNNGCPL